MIQVEPVFIELDVFQDLSGTPAVVPESGTACELPVFFGFQFAVLDVKETSLSRQAATANRSVFQSS